MSHGKPLRILHLLAQVEVTGAERFAATLANQQTADGHTVHIVSGVFQTPTAATVHLLPLHKRSWGYRLRNVRAIRRLIREQQIDVVHAHARAASWVGFFAVWGTKVPLLSSIHGRQHLHTSSKGFDIYGDRLLPVCEDIATHLRAELNIAPRKVHMVPNALDFSTEAPGTPASGQVLSIIGRTSGPKGEATADLLLSQADQLFSALPQLQIEVLGGPVENLPPSCHQPIRDLLARYEGRLHWPGFVNDLSQRIQRSSLIVGAGRVAIEALAMGKPVLALGEAQSHGVVTEANLAAAFASNFGDTCPTLPFPGFDFQAIGDGILAFFRQPHLPSEALRQAVRHRYDLRRIATLTEDHYRDVRMLKHHPRHIPVLMYHKVLDQPSDSRHRIFVTEDTFRAHVEYLKKLGFKSLTFKEYDDYKQGIRDLKSFPDRPVFITFDDGYVDNLTRALPLLEAHGLKATLFALGDRTHRDNFWDVAEGERSEPLMSPEQLREWHARGMEIGAHSMNHRRLSQLPPAVAQWEIEESKRQLEAFLGEEVRVFAYPYGDLNDTVKQLTAAAGFRYAVATTQGGQLLEDDRFEIYRAYVFPQDRPGLFGWKKAQSWYRRYYFWKRGT